MLIHIELVAQLLEDMCTEGRAFPDCTENTSLQIMNEGKMFTLKINYTYITCEVYRMKHLQYDLESSALA